jgi:hypothetical protein
MFGGSGPSVKAAEAWMRTFTLRELDDSLNVYVGKIKDALLYGLRHQVNPQQVAAWLYKATQDARINWQLIARTEMNRANAIGRLHAARDMGFDRVWVPPHIGACDSCKRLLENQVFDIDELLNASNYGRPEAEWVACCPLHPRCRHSYLPYVAEIYEDAMAHYPGSRMPGSPARTASTSSSTAAGSCARASRSTTPSATRSRGRPPIHGTRASSRRLCHTCDRARKPSTKSA